MLKTLGSYFLSGELSECATISDSCLQLFPLRMARRMDLDYPIMLYKTRANIGLFGSKPKEKDKFILQSLVPIALVSQSHPIL